MPHRILRYVLRFVARNKSYSLVNALGLGASMAVSLVIIAFLVEQQKWDRFHEHADRIYRVNTDVLYGRDRVYNATSPAALGDILQESVPGVEAVTRLFQGEDVNIGEPDNWVRLKAHFASESLFDIFDYELASGNARQALAQPLTAVITEETAQLVFGSANPTGEFFNVVGYGDVQVTGVLKPNQGKSHISFDLLLSYSTLISNNTVQSGNTNWPPTLHRNHTYVLLDSPEREAELARQFPGLIETHFTGEPGVEVLDFVLQPLASINLGPSVGNSISPVLPRYAAYILGGLAFILLVLGCFNYVNVSLANSQHRRFEVGVRKINGASRPQLIRQFILESIMVAFIALIPATLLMLLLIPAFNNLYLFTFFEQARISIAAFNSPAVYIIFFLFCIVVGGLGGIYPALRMSSTLPMHLLRKRVNSTGARSTRYRTVLLTIQFGVTFVFIVTLLTGYGQFKNMLNIDYGFENKDVINLALEDAPYTVLRSEFLKHPGVLEVSAASNVPILGGNRRIPVTSDGLQEEMMISILWVDEHFIDNMGLNLLEGRGFSSEFASDRTQAVILNEAAVHALKFSDIDLDSGRRIYFERDDEAMDLTVIGVVNDFHHQDLTRSIDPLMIELKPQWTHFANVRIDPNRSEEIITHLENSWHAVGQTGPLNYAFYESQLEGHEMNRSLADLLKIVGLVTVFALLISCLGIFTMALNNTQARLKEIGVRRVLGASIGQVFGLLGRELGLPIVGSLLLGLPIAWYLNQAWLQEFVIRITPGFFTFAFGVCLVLGMAAAIVVPIVLRAARVNPVEILRYE